MADAGRLAGTGVLPVVLALALLAWLTVWTTRGAAEPLADAPKLCGEATEALRGAAALPNMVRALRDRKRIKVLAIGATPLAARDQDKGTYALVEAFLESNFKGLDVEIIDRGVSGELARDAALR
ncbi:MAG: hypothetical protein SFW09_17435, partial [Hyphomicrobiaceae bacterium]|nr:hypothetical protein [Hyphomicrobiaceae bacterium]